MLQFPLSCDSLIIRLEASSDDDAFVTIAFQWLVSFENRGGIAYGFAIPISASADMAS
jgi:hypothetical protein